MLRIALLAALVVGSTVGIAQAQLFRADDSTSRSCVRHFKVAMTDEYGFRYDSRGDRLNARGCVIPPPHTPPGARAYRD
jgi:hypothetical protein